MASETILTGFRAVTAYSTGDYADLDVTDKAEPWAVAFYNGVMGTSLTITTHTTGETRPDSAIVYLCAYYATLHGTWRNKMVIHPPTGEQIHFFYIYMQLALMEMRGIDPTKVEYDAVRMWYYVSDSTVATPYSGISMYDNNPTETTAWVHEQTS